MIYCRKMFGQVVDGFTQTFWGPRRARAVQVFLGAGIVTSGFYLVMLPSPAVGGFSLAALHYLTPSLTVLAILLGFGLAPRLPSTSRQSKEALLRARSDLPASYPVYFQAACAALQLCLQFWPWQALRACQSLGRPVRYNRSSHSMRIRFSSFPWPVSFSQSYLPLEMLLRVVQ